MEKNKKRFGRGARRSLRRKRCSFFGLDETLCKEITRKRYELQAGKKSSKGVHLDLVLKVVQLLVQLLLLIKAIESVI